MPMSSSRFFLVLCLGIVLTNTALAAPKRHITDWLSLDSEKTKQWSTHLRADERYVDISPTQSGEVDKRILVLMERPSSAYDTALSQILAVFGNKNIRSTFEVVRVGKDLPFIEATLKKAETDGIDMVYALGSSTVANVYKLYKNGALPVVSVCAKDPVLLGQMSGYETGSQNNFAFTSLNAPAETLFKYLLSLKPDLKNVAVLYAEQNTSSVQTQYKPMIDPAQKMGVSIIGVGVKDRTQAAKELRTLIPAAIAQMKESDPALQNSVFWITGSTSVFQEIALINSYTKNIPVLSAVTDVVQPGLDSAVLSIGIGFDTNAHLAAIYGLDILSGRPAGELPVGLVSPPDIAINFLKARQINMKIPFDFFEISNFIYDQNGQPVRMSGEKVMVKK
ncbi:ABC transporter substrate-binding protein [Terasakiella sp.]|uniref:ABC transporter substrate-binding protein n=1 Tax=Terasakiella sp. TaxID=2034861 RepID=UPI003AA7D0D6